MGLLNIFKRKKGKGDKPELTKKPGKERLAELEAAKKEAEVKKTFKEMAAKKAEKPAAETETKKSAAKPKVKKRKNSQAFRVLIKPIVTEKSAYLGSLNQYIFEVSSEANKIMVKKAVENIYGVKPIKVNIINVLGKDVRFGRTRGRTKDRKKAVVTLREGDKLDVYEGV
jgi:large subunit ribosomal protein L23